MTPTWVLVFCFSHAPTALSLKLSLADEISANATSAHGDDSVSSNGYTNLGTGYCVGANGQTTLYMRDRGSDQNTDAICRQLCDDDDACLGYGFKSDVWHNCHSYYASGQPLTAHSWYTGYGSASDIAGSNGGYADGLNCMKKTSSAPASAQGDPHLQNVHGERFDLMTPGNHVLINIPRGERAENTLLRVQAFARRLGGQCEDIYFTEVNVTGSWAYAQNAGGLHYDSQGNTSDMSNWITLGRVDVKVVHAHTATGTKYLNVYIKHLGQAGFDVGGLLGEDDHVAVSTPPVGCLHHASLENSRGHPYSRNSPAASTAEAALA